MDFNGIISTMAGMKNINMGGVISNIPENKFNCSICYDDPEGRDCSNCNGSGHLDTGWGEYVNCNHCEGSGKQPCRCQIDRLDRDITAGENEGPTWLPENKINESHRDFEKETLSLVKDAYSELSYHDYSSAIDYLEFAMQVVTDEDIKNKITKVLELAYDCPNKYEEAVDALGRLTNLLDYGKDEPIPFNSEYSDSDFNFTESKVNENYEQEETFGNNSRENLLLALKAIKAGNLNSAKTFLDKAYEYKPEHNFLVAKDLLKRGLKNKAVDLITQLFSVREDLDQGFYGSYGSKWAGGDSHKEYWAKDEMDFPEEDKFKHDIAGEKVSDEDINDHDLTVDDQLEQEGLAENSVINKLAKRKLEGKCIGCGHKECTCKTKGKLRDHPKGIGRSEVREPSTAAIDHEMEYLKKQKIGESKMKQQKSLTTILRECVAKLNEIDKKPTVNESWFNNPKKNITKEQVKFYKNVLAALKFINRALNLEVFTQGTYHKQVTPRMLETLKYMIRDAIDVGLIGQVGRVQQADENSPFYASGMVDKLSEVYRFINEIQTQYEIEKNYDPTYDISDLFKLLEEAQRECYDILEPLKSTVTESAPSDQETWVRKNKARFIKEYGKEKGLSVLYSLAWKRHKGK